MYPAIVLVGGKGERLGSLAGETPKPLLDVAGKPFLVRVLGKLHRSGVEVFVLACTTRNAQEFRGLPYGVMYSTEHDPLGTAGAVREAAVLVSGTVLVVNGDSYTDADLAAFASLHVSLGARVSMLLSRVADASEYGHVEVVDHSVRAFTEKPDRPGPGLVNAGVYLIDRDVVELIPRGIELSLERDFFPVLATQGMLTGIELPGAFYDIGTPERLARAEEHFAA